MVALTNLHLRSRQLIFCNKSRQKLDILELKRYQLHVLHLEDSPHLKVVGLPSFYFALSVYRNSEDRKNISVQCKR